MAALSSGHPWVFTLYRADSVMSLPVSSRKWCSLLSCSLGFLQFCSDSISTQKTKMCYFCGNLLCRGSMGEGVGEMECWLSLVHKLEAVTLQSHSILRRCAGAVFSGFVIIVSRGW